MRKSVCATTLAESLALLQLPFQVNNIRGRILEDEIVDDSDHFLESLKSSALEFGLTEVVSGKSIEGSYAPTVAVDGVGNVHVAWEDYTESYTSGSE